MPGRCVLAFLLGPTLAVQLQHVVDIVRAISESAGVAWDPSVEAELRRTDFDELLRSYAGAEAPGECGPAPSDDRACSYFDLKNES